MGEMVRKFGVQLQERRTQVKSK